MTTMKFQINTW